MYSDEVMKPGYCIYDLDLLLYRVFDGYNLYNFLLSLYETKDLLDNNIDVSII